MATHTEKSPAVDPATEDSGLISATVVAGLKNLGTIITPALTKILIANALKLTLHPDASEWAWVRRFYKTVVTYMWDLVLL